MKFTKMMTMLVLTCIFVFNITQVTVAEESFCIVPVKLKVIQYAQIIQDPIVLKQESGKNFKGQTILTIYNNFPMQITAEIKSIGTKVADNYMCKLGDTNWGKSVSVTTAVHLFGNPKRMLLCAKLEM